MRKYLLGAAAALAVVAPNMASATTTGYVGLGYTSIDDDDDGAKDNYLTLDGGVVSDIGGGWNVQFDATSDAMDHDTHNDPFTTVTAHVFMRNADWAAGGFIGKNARSDSDFWHAGLEGQLYQPNFTLGAAYTHADEINSSGANELDMVGVSGDFFFTPSTSLGADVSWYDDSWESEDGLMYGVSLEHQFAGSPISVGAHYHVTDGDYDFGGGHTTDMFGVFARWNFGTADLQTRSREGASFGSGTALDREEIGTW